MISVINTYIYFLDNKAWERAKMGLKSVNDECRIDLRELSGDPLEVGIRDMDNGRRQMNGNAEVRTKRVPGFLWTACLLSRTLVRVTKDQVGASGGSSSRCDGPVACASKKSHKESVGACCRRHTKSFFQNVSADMRREIRRYSTGEPA